MKDIQAQITAIEETLKSSLEVLEAMYPVHVEGVSLLRPRGDGKVKEFSVHLCASVVRAKDTDERKDQE